MNKPWFSSSYRRWLVDMHIPDWDAKFLSKIDPEKYAELMTVAGVDTAILYAGSCLGICYWPTRVGHMHDGLKGRDLLKELIAACRKRDLHIVVYFNVWSRWAYDTHPEWRIVLPNGKGTVDEGSRYGICCPNTGYKDYVLAQLEDLCTHYDLDGLWIDMIGWFSKICYCPACLDRFQHERGTEPPRIIDWSNPNWVAFQRRREEWMADFAEAMTGTAKRIRADISVALQHTSLLHGWAGGVNERFTRQSDYLAGDFGGGALEESVICKLLNGLSMNRPVEFMMPCCENLWHHTTDKPVSTLLMEAYAAIANQCCYVLIDAIDPDGTQNRQLYEAGGKIFGEVRRYEPYLNPAAEIVADVAIYWSLPSMIDPDRNGMNIAELGVDLSYYAKIKEIARTLIQDKIPFTVITRKDLPQLGKYQWVILSDTLVMDPAEVDAFRTYVRNGGNLYASARTSLHDPDGGLSSDLQLADVFGVHYGGRLTDENITYISPAGRRAPFWGNCTGTYPVMLQTRQVIVRADPTAEVLGRLTLPCGDSREPHRFSSANSNPPQVWTPRPALVRNVYGKGQAVYCAGPLEKEPFAKHRKIFAGLLSETLATPAFASDAPKPVEIILYDDKPRKRLLVNVLNYQDTLPPVPVHDIRMRINMKGRTPTSLVLVPDNRRMNYMLSDDGMLEFTVDSVWMYGLYVITYNGAVTLP